jgi:hypothetical protein
VTTHLLKLCVGVDRVEQLTEWGREERGRGGAPIVHTRNTPKRAAEVLDGGSLYWVIKGAVLCRQAVVGIETIGEGPLARCEIELSPAVVRVLPTPKRAFQGWRYLESAQAPPDLRDVSDADLPPELARELRALGAW